MNVRRAVSRCAGVTVLLLAFGSIAQASTFTVTSIDYPGAVWTVAEGINASGQIVGQYLDTSGLRHGFLFSGGVYSTIDCPNPYTFRSDAIGINAAGTIVGVCSAPGGINGVYGTSVSYTFAGGTFTLLPDIGGSYLNASTFAQGINDSGQIVGWYADATLSNGHGFIYQGGSYTTFDVPGFASTFGYAINNSGQVVGATQPIFGASPSHGFLLTGGLFSTYDPPGSASTAANHINDAGQIVGAYFDAANVQHGFLRMGGAYTTFDVSGATGTSVVGNDLAGLVGGYADAGGKEHGFVYQLCQDTLSLTYAGGALTMGFTLKTTFSGSWSAWLGVQGHVVPLWTGLSIPAVSPAASLSIPIPSFPMLGPVYVLTSLSNTGGSFCADWKVVNTGP